MEIAERVAELVRIPSVNPLHAGPKSGDAGERDLSDWLANHADSLGGDVVVDEVEDGRCNVYARFEGASDRAITVDVHLDTVGVEHMSDDPFDGRIEDGRVYGRGSVDTKPTFAVVLQVLEELRNEGRRPVPTVNLIGTVSEEGGGLLGAARYRDWLLDRGQRVEQMVVAEPTMCAPVHGHKGGIGLDVTVHGHAAHSSKPHLGANALSGAARVVIAIDEEQERLAALDATTPVGKGTVSVTELSGGLARNIIPDACALYVGRRTAPGENIDEVRAALCELIENSAAPLSTTIESLYGDGSPGFYQDPSCSLVTVLAQLADTAPTTADYGSNALRYGEVADELVVFGPGSIDQAHQAVEWVDIGQLERSLDIYRSWFTQ
ncbi:MAG: M20/M25/M40 family metallo-hydrolase [Actinomycetota bacterium]|nr:M20/M25/M40 family metallo-hydrolase [Actinomycetota bacterium]MEC9059339.1 M20/M25/M40 family metallo-hydrolase [Actinomycetota bacterium]MED5361060.1 M20/M25/M40 family metallo-hydrolase [Actinomycetota bacterium]